MTITRRTRWISRFVRLFPSLPSILSLTLPPCNSFFLVLHLFQYDRLSRSAPHPRPASLPLRQSSFTSVFSRSPFLSFHSFPSPVKHPQASPAALPRRAHSASDDQIPHRHPHRSRLSSNPSKIRFHRRRVEIEAVQRKLQGLRRRGSERGNRC